MDIAIKDIKLADKKCREYTISNDNMNVKILSLGATIYEINVPDKFGNLENVVLKHNNLISYSANPFYFGATIGRTAGRIKEGRVKVKNKVYQLVKNNAGNTLHGGKHGFSLANFKETKIIRNNDYITIVLTYISKHMEEGYPGDLRLDIWYTLNKNNEFKVEYKAISNQDTVCNISNHSYFNLNPLKSVLEENLIINANNYYENQGGLIIGKREKVDNTPFDFRVEKKINHDIDNPLLHVFTNGYDHLFEFNEDKEHIIYKDYDSGRMMTIYSTYKACQVFNLEFKKRDSFYSGITFECQKLPYRIENEYNEILLLAERPYNEAVVYKYDIIGK